ncbi:MAG: tetratricopeptide repeat protein, partial [Acidobacteriota bacterium]
KAPVEELPEILELDLQPAVKPEAEPAVEPAPAGELAELARLAELEKEAASSGTLDLSASPEPSLPTADLIPLEELDEAPIARPEITEPEFDEEVDSALDSLFSGEPLEEAPEEVLRYDVAATGSSDEATNPKVHYDLGLAYKEMGLVEDAVQEFQTAAQMLKSPIYNPQRILCCSMLANSLLQLGHFSEAYRWAEEGLRIPGKKEFEWKALKYDAASALERQGKYPEALEAFREILDRDPEYRDVLTRIDNLLRIQ